MSRKCMWLSVAMLVLAAGPALAQTTGAIHGKTVDHEGMGLPGVTVALAGEPIPGSGRATVTDAEGKFKFPGLPIGRYSMTATMNGFQDRSADDVRISIDTVTAVTFTMHPTAFAGEIAVECLRAKLIHHDQDHQPRRALWVTAAERRDQADGGRQKQCGGASDQSSLQLEQCP